MSVRFRLPGWEACFPDREGGGAPDGGVGTTEREGWVSTYLSLRLLVPLQVLAQRRGSWDGVSVFSPGICYFSSLVTPANPTLVDG